MAGHSLTFYKYLYGVLCGPHSAEMICIAIVDTVIETVIFDMVIEGYSCLFPVTVPVPFFWKSLRAGLSIFSYAVSQFPSILANGLLTNFASSTIIA